MSDIKGLPRIGGLGGPRGPDDGPRGVGQGGVPPGQRPGGPGAPQPPPTQAPGTQPPPTQTQPPVGQQPPTTQMPPTSTPTQAPTQVPDTYRTDLPPDTTANLHGEGVGMKRPAAELAPDLRQVRSLPDVQNKFAADYSLVAKQLHNAPDTPPPEKAQRAFEYFTKYAERFVQIANREPAAKAEPAPTDASQVAKSQEGQQTGMDGRAMDGLPKTQIQDGTARTGQEPPKDLIKDGKLKPEELARLQQTRGELQTQETGRPKSRLEMLEMLQEMQEQPTSSELQQRDVGNPKDVKRGQEGQGAGGKRSDDGQQLLPKELKELRFVDLSKYTPAEREALAKKFAESLKDLAFDQIYDQRSGKDGVESALDLLLAKSLKQLQDAASQKQMTTNREWPPQPPPPKSEQLVQEQNKQKQAAQEFTGAPKPQKDIGDSPAALTQLQQADPRKDGVEFKVNTLATELGKVLITPRDPHEGMDAVSQSDGDEGRTNKRLGSNMFWNILHRYRKSGADSAVEKAKWDRLTFGALLTLIVITIVAIILVTL